MKTINTNWSTPKRNIFTGINDLRKALASGMNAKLIKMRNEDCAYPIKIRQFNLDFRNYKFMYGTLKTYQDIVDDNMMSEMQKYLTLNFKTCYGTQEAKEHYYKTNLLSNDNLIGTGVSHLVRIKDLIVFLKNNNKNKKAKLLENQYILKTNERSFYDFFSLELGSKYVPKKFKHKLWVVELLENKPEHKIPMFNVLNVLTYLLKYIPKRSVLKMPEYTNYTFRIGDVIHGFSIEIQVPKKFSFK